MGFVEYVQNKIYALVAFFLSFELFTSGVSEKGGSGLQYAMLAMALILALAGLYFFRKRMGSGKGKKGKK